MSIRVLIADDQALLRATFRLLLDSAADLEVIGEAATGAEAVEMAHRGVDVVLMDIQMPEMDGIEATRRIVDDPDLPDTKVLILTTFETDTLVMAALRAGATGFIGKGIEPAGLLDAVRTVAAGEALLSPAATTALIGRVLQEPSARQQPSGSPALVDELTPREVDITGLVGTGLSNAEIAERLFISVATVKTHVNRAMMKVAARDRAQLVIFAYEHGLLPS